MRGHDDDDEDATAMTETKAKMHTLRPLWEEEDDLYSIYEGGGRGAAHKIMIFADITCKVSQSGVTECSSSPVHVSAWPESHLLSPKSSFSILLSPAEKGRKVLGCATACRESFRVFTFITCFVTQPAGLCTVKPGY